MSQELANKALVLYKEIIDGWQSLIELTGSRCYPTITRCNPELAKAHSERCQRLFYLFVSEFPHPAPAGTSEIREQVAECRAYFETPVGDFLNDLDNHKPVFLPILMARGLFRGEKLAFELNHTFKDGDAIVNGWSRFNEIWIKGLILHGTII